MNQIFNQIKSRRLKFVSMLVSALMVLQLCFFCPCAYAEYNKLIQVLKVGENLTVEDIKPIVEENPACINETYEGMTIFYYVISQGKNTAENRAAIIQYLIEKGANPNQDDKDGWTPLYWSILADNDTCVKVLLENGADPNKTHDDSFTPLKSAISFGRVKCARLLLEKGVDPNQVDKDGQTPLHLAARKKSIECVKLLIEKGANLNLKDENGNTPLYTGVLFKKYDCVKVLLESGANPNLRNKSGITPLKVAIIFNRVDFIQLLLEKGADPYSVSLGSGIVRNTGIEALLIFYRNKRLSCADGV